MPFRATSMMPSEKVDPMMMPIPAIIMIVFRGATLAPIAELRKLTASLTTPTIRLPKARETRKITARSSKLGIFLVFMDFGKFAGLFKSRALVFLPLKKIRVRFRFSVF